MVLVIGLTAGIANADLLASESFEYTADASLEDQNGGTGWAGPWEAWEDGSGFTIGAGSLEPPDVGGTGNHVEVVDNTYPGDAEDGFERDLTTPLLDDGSTYWVSVVFQKSNNDNASSWCGFVLGNIWFGKGYELDNFLLLEDATGGQESETTGVPVTDLSWLVLKIETNPDAQEQVYLWVNPDSVAEPSTATANANIEMALVTGGVDSFVVEYGSLGTANAGDFKCDEIKIGTSFNDVVDYFGPKNPIKVDPNVMTVYETDETEGNFTVALRFPPLGQEPLSKATDGTPISMEIIVDPNGFGGGGSPDITLIGNDGPPHYRVTFTRTTANWDTPEVIRFKAIDDDLAEPPTLAEAQNIVVWAVPTPHEPNLAQPVAQKVVGGVVMDNDQANILFSVTPFRGGARVPVIGPVKLFEQYTASDLLKWRKIFFKMQVQPENDADPGSPTSVKLNAVVTGEIEGDNLPPTDPCLPLTDDPNCFTFTSTTSDGETGLPGDCADWNTGTKTSCWDVPQPIKIWGNDDDVLQVEAFADGDEDYHAVLVVTVIDGGGDERYEWTEIDDEDPCNPVEFQVFLEKEVQFDIEDNECGAFGILALDIGNPNAFTDPNYRDSEGNPLPDCYVDIYDVIELATKWLDCSNIQDPSCESYL